MNSFERILKERIIKFKKDYKDNKLDICIKNNIIVGNTLGWFETMEKFKHKVKECR